MKRYIIFFSCILLINICRAQNANFCNNFMGYDSTYYQNFDTLHYKIFGLCKKSNELRAFYTYMKTDSIDIPDGRYQIYINGLVTEEGFYAKGQLSDYIIRYYPSGFVREFIKILSDSVCMEKVFFENGYVKHTGFLKHGKKNGKWLYYYDNGHLMKTENFIQVKITKDNYIELIEDHGILTGEYVSLKDGYSRFFNEEGKLSSEEFYEKGKQINIHDF